MNRLWDAVNDRARAALGRWRAASGRPPRLELRIPVSPRDADLRMVRYLLASIREFGGPIARAARCVLSVGDEAPPRDLRAEYPWLDEYPVDIRWVDPGHFARWRYDATGFDRYFVRSDADLVAMLDADLLVGGDFDDILLQAHREQRMLGFISHVSPFGFESHGGISGDETWARMYRAAGLTPPPLTFQYSGWGLDFSEFMPRPHDPIISNHPEHRHCPPYFNYGVIVGPRRYFDRMAASFVQDLETVAGVMDTPYASQIANCIGFERHRIPCGTIPLNCNFPMNLPPARIRSVNPDPRGEERDEDIRIFHYIGGRRHFESPESLEKLLAHPRLPGVWPAFRARLRAVQARIGSDQPSPCR